MKIRRWFTGAAIVLGAAAATRGALALLSTAYVRTNLVSDIPGEALVTDPNLVNPWGIVALPGGPIWIADNGTDEATAYLPTGEPAPSSNHRLIVGLPDSPTGLVANTTPAFLITEGPRTAPAQLLFAGEGGTILGWNSTVDPTEGIVAFDASAEDAVYKGIALSPTRSGPRLYLADFHNDLVEAFDGAFVPRTVFTDGTLPGYAPFNVAVIGGRLFVSFAKQVPGSDDEEDGPGLGFVDEFTLEGSFIKRLISQGPLNAPWAMVQAPSGFGVFSGALLVGNFGDGTINAFDISSGAFLGTVRDTGGQPLVTPGLWGLTFGRPAGGTAGSLYFAAGINDEADGLFGIIRPAP